MPSVSIRFYCTVCKKTINFQLTEDQQEEFSKKADKWPYPLLIPHSDHWAIVYLDKDFRDRSTVITKCSIPKID